MLIRRRAEATGELAPAAAAAHARLSASGERLAVAYEPRAGSPDAALSAPEEEVAAALPERLAATRGRDIAAGLTLTGPHRDDLVLTLDGQPASVFASRGQQRTAALALRLAEAELLHERAGERPLFLLDDVLSELDAARRASVLGTIEADQVFITSADADRLDAGFVARAQRWHVDAGQAARM